MRILLTLLTSLAFSQAFAGGYEKNIMWSGKYGALGGAATSSVTGAEALFWNPARLGAGENDKSLSMNLSYLAGDFGGPAIEDDQASGTATDDRNESTDVGSAVPAFMYAHKLNEKLTLATGFYVPAGTKIEYTDIKAADADVLTVDVGSDLAGLEFGIGLSYQLNEKHALGGSIRYLQTQATFKSAAINSGASTIVNVGEFKDLEGNGLGFKLGYSFMPNDTWGIGVRYRSTIEVDNDGTGETSGKIRATGGTFATSASGNVSITTELPQSLNIGTHYKVSDTWTLYADLWWTNYSVIDKLQFKFDSGSTAEVELNFSDMYNIRFAGEFTGYKMPIRFGYVATTPVSDPEYARATLTPPALAHTFTVGSGYAFNEKMALNYAVQYDTASEDVDTAEGVNPPKGTYEATGYALHLGFDYNF